MGRRRGPSKAEQRRQRAEQLSREQFIEFVGDAKATRQDLDDATTANASVFKRGDNIGIHRGAVKLYLQLDRMEETKRNDFLRAFDTYREWAHHWEAQPDLLEVGAEDAAEPGPGEGDGDAEQEPAEPEHVPPEPVEAAAPVEEPVAGPEADWGETQADGQPELERAGFVYAEGQAAGAMGASAEQNPHAAASPLHAIWERGRNNPAQSEAPQEAEAEAEPESQPRRRRRRGNGAAAEGGDHQVSAA